MSVVNRFQVHFLFFNVEGETWMEKHIYVHEMVPMEWNRRTCADWANESLGEYSPDDLRSLMELPEEGCIQVLAIGTLTGYSYPCDYGTEWDEDLEFEEVQSEALSDEFVSIYLQMRMTMYSYDKTVFVKVMEAFGHAIRRRCEHPTGFHHQLGTWSLSDWFTALGGELGEAMNFGKKLNRIRDGIPGNSQEETAEYLKAALADELADVFIYLDLLAQSQGINLGQAIIDKFDKTSTKIGYVEG